MATTLVQDRCLRCGETISPGEKTVYVTGCNVTREPRLASYNPPSYGPLKPIPEGKLRINLIGNTPIKGVVHISCWEDMMR